LQSVAAGRVGRPGHGEAGLVPARPGSDSASGRRPRVGVAWPSPRASAAREPMV